MTATVERRTNPSHVEGSTQKPRSKRKRGNYEGREIRVAPPSQQSITQDFLKRCRTEFESNPQSRIVRNAIATVGPLFAATDAEEVRKVSHVFLHTLKPEHAKATNQEASGRCWLFAGLNIFRNHVMHAFNVKKFEFSQSHLYFWHMIEQSNHFLREISQNLDTALEDRYVTKILKRPVVDGGYWSTFVNLVNKYGLMPKEAMPETAGSRDSTELNTTIKNILRAAACHLRENHRTLGLEGVERVRKETMRQIYDITVKFLGQPPEEFDWSYTDADYKSYAIKGLTPETFKALLFKLFAKAFSMDKDYDLDDYVVLANLPQKEHPFYQPYVIKASDSVVGGKPHIFINVPIADLKKYAAESIMREHPVWFGSDVSKGFHPLENTLNERLLNYDSLFGSTFPLDKAKRIDYRISRSTHAMCLTGVDFENPRKPAKWQVENSWGYSGDDDDSTDGYLTMDGSWFDDNVFEVVVPISVLSRAITGAMRKDPLPIENWDPVAEMLQIP